MAEDISYKDGSNGKKEQGEGIYRGENNPIPCKWEPRNKLPRRKLSSATVRDYMFEL